MLLRLKMPWRKSLKMTTSGRLAASDSPRVRRARSEIARLSTRSTWSILYPSAMKRSFWVVGRVRSMKACTVMPAASRSRRTKSFTASLPSTVEKDTSPPAALTCLATTAAPPAKTSVRSCLTLNVGDFAVAPRSEQWL